VIEHPTIGGVVFCRAIHAASTTNGNIDTEFWSTKKDARVAVITFTKKYNPASFDVNAYRAFVPTLMSTFQYPTTSTTP
ncbi:hypothetical protein KBA73_04340, partial [Patescibacteria group bacterium]|nr:hypothetical protein [Patescibacteria group bacterium]